MNSELQRKVLLIAYYMGKTEAYMAAAHDKPVDISYHANISLLWPAAQKVRDELVEIQGAMRKAMREDKGNVDKSAIVIWTSCLVAIEAIHKQSIVYIPETLFEAVVTGVEIINKFRNAHK